MNLTVIGTGYVGLVTGTCFAEMGNKVYCVDIDENKINNLKKGIIPIYEPHLATMVIDNQAKNNLFFTKDLREALDDSNIIYWNRQIFGREFDVCILMPNKGILVVELKGWREENILRVENNEYAVIQTEDGEIAANPQKQARGYRFSLERYGYE